MLKRILDFLCAAIVQPLPAGITPDVPGVYGLIGLQNNVNKALANQVSSITDAATSIFLTAGQLAAGLLILDGTSGGGVAARVPSAAQIMAFFGASVPVDSTFAARVRIASANGQTVTVTASTGVTLTGTMTIADGSYRDLLIIPTGQNAITIRNMGGGST